MLTIDDLSVRIAGRLVIEGASVQVPAGAHVGLVGRNGAGKSTLFRVISGDLASERGQVTLPARARLGAVAQEAPSGNVPLIDVVLAADVERARLLREADTCHDPHRIAEIQTRLADIDAHSAPARAAAILAGLGFDEAAQARPCSSFSGGWRMRVALAAVLFAEPDVLLLDEPTNYLDLEGTLWLESWLARFRGTALVISHDRDLLDGLDHILHLEGGRLTLYRGGYSTFARTRAERMALDLKLAKRQAAERARLTAFVERFKAKASKARQAQSRVKALAKLEPIATIVEDSAPPIRFPVPARLPSPPIIALDDVAVGYGGTPVLTRLDLRIDTDDRIALLGPNGNGKSTFAKLVAGRLAPTGGRMTVADKLGIGYFAQHQLDELRPAESPYQHVRPLMREAPEPRVRARVAEIGFPGERADTPVAALSGGEKARLMLGLATFAAPQLLILDEPTNHLDVDARDSLVEAISDFPGAVILVSHDRHLLDACADRLWLVGGGTVKPFEGDLDDYRARVLAGTGEAADERTEAAKATRTENRRAAAERRAELAPLRARVTDAERRIAAAESEIAKLDRWLAQPGIFEKEPAKAARAAKLRAEHAAAHAAAEEDWLDASAALEAANTG